MVRVLSAEFIKTSVSSDDYPAERLPEVAFAGRSNVGKSTLINALVNQRRLAITSTTPGRTRAVNFFKVRLSPDPRPEGFAGLASYFVDLPGYGYAKVPNEMRQQWQPLVESYLEGNPWLRGVMLLIDARRNLGDEERQLMGYLRTLAVPYQIVLTKCDKLSGNEWSAKRRAIAEELSLPHEARPIPFSALKKKGMDPCLDRIGEMITLGRPIVDVAADLAG
jgi:GTP-binding protein